MFGVAQEAERPRYLSCFQVETKHRVLHELPKILTGPDIFLPIIMKRIRK
jgi:hypothetical protein